MFEENQNNSFIQREWSLTCSLWGQPVGIMFEQKKATR